MIDRSSKAVGNWLLLGVFMLVIQIALGGITRLTGSGLSITQWDVITGAVPPMNDKDWMVEFQKYQQTPQYRLMNSDFDLKNFKFIFFWEWFHRFWGRLIGIVFAIGFVYFIVKKKFKKEMINPMIILFLLGALQGAIGWIMVASGLTGDAVYVRPTRLALHFIFAMLLISYTLWFALKLLVNENERSFNPKLKNFTWTIIALIAVQLIYGALMAGHKAATAAPTWPDINGHFLPPNSFSESPVSVNFIDNKQLIHFIHRNLAYLLLILTGVWFVRAKKYATGIFKRNYYLPLLFIFIQVLLGIFAVLNSLKIIPNQWGIFEWTAQLHQLVGMLVLLSFVYMLFLLTGRKRAV
jgi:heme a synthase